MTGTKLAEYRRELAGKEAAQILAWSQAEFGPDRVILASSFSIEDQVLTHMLSRLNPAARIFTLDTCRQFQETYAVMQQTIEKYCARRGCRSRGRGRAECHVPKPGPSGRPAAPSAS